jgi:Aspartyl/Asparaginyl beta-hydroxylase
VEGKGSVFDDEFSHEVWNFISREQVVFIVYLWRSDLSSVEIELLEATSRYASS